MALEQHIGKFSLVLLVYLIIHPIHSQAQDWPKHVKVGAELGVGFPHEWFSAKPVAKVSPNAHAGLVLGYDVIWQTVYKSYKWGPEVGLSYGFTRRSHILSQDKSLTERYLHVPISLKFLRYIEDDELGYLALGGSIGYEFNILLSSIYTDYLGSAKLRSGASVATPDGPPVVVPSPRGSLVGNAFVGFAKGIYIGVRFRLPGEYWIKKAPNQYALSQDFIYHTREQATSGVELYMGIDIMKWF